MEDIKVSPPPNFKKTLTFTDAMAIVSKGQRVTREEWNDKRWYGILKDGMLQIHKAGEAEDTTHPWIINDGDLAGEDYLIL